MIVHSGTTAAVLLVDEAEVRPLADRLVQERFSAHVVGDGPTALSYAHVFRPDAIILETALPGVTGVDLLRQLRADGVKAPALFLSSRATLQDRLAGLSGGGDDFIAKPCDPDEVVVRVRAVLRRSQFADRGSASLVVADLVLDQDNREVRKNGRPVTLAPKQFDILRYLMMNAGIVLSKRKILDRLWLNASPTNVNVVESRICQLRQKVDTGERALIHTVRGCGYVIREPR